MRIFINIYGANLENKKQIKLYFTQHKYDKARKQTINHKIEKFLWIHSSQVKIIDYYITNRNGIIAWVKLNRRMTNAIFRRASQSASKEFRTSVFVPQLARDRKACLDRLLLEFKEKNSNFCYIIKNGKHDLNILIKKLLLEQTAGPQPR